MSAIKERIIGAISVMNEKDAEKVWQLILATVSLTNAEEVDAEPDEIEALNAYHNGDEEYQPVYSQDDLIRELGL